MLTESGAVKKLSELSVGDRVQSMNEQGQLVFSPILLFLDRDLNDQRQFVQLQSADGAKVTLTASHLIYTVAASQDLLEDVDIGGDNFQQQQQQMNEIERVEEAEEENQLLDRLMVNVTVGQLGSRLRATFASKVQIGDWIVTTGRDGRPVPQRVVDVSAVVHQGVLAPLTDQGTLVVDQVVVSCYAVIDNQAIAHWAFAPSDWPTTSERVSSTFGVHSTAQSVHHHRPADRHQRRLRRRLPTTTTMLASTGTLKCCTG